MDQLNRWFNWNQVFLLLACLLLCIRSGVAVQCLECNVWKAGYGHLCDNPLYRDDCLLCMKMETTIFMGYYKNTPRSSTIISRICSKSKTVSFGDECHYYPMASGVSVQCYCNSDRCNGANPSRNIATPAILVFSGLSVVLARWLT